MNTKNKKTYRRLRIKMRIRKTVIGTPDRPRMSVHRSNKQIYVQLIDDSTGNSLLAASSRESDVQYMLKGGVSKEKLLRKPRQPVSLP